MRIEVADAQLAAAGYEAKRAIELMPLTRQEPMQLRSESISKWWPTTQSLDLVEGAVEMVAAGVETEVKRFLGGEEVTTSWEAFPSVDAAFQAAPEFTNVPTFYLVLPSRSRWTVLWNNSFLCDGYDSLCWCLTQNHGFTTVHWSAHDEWTTFQSGAFFHHRQRHGDSVVDRFVQCGQEDKRWFFYEKGEPLPEENVGSYEAKRKRDRLNEVLVAQFLGRLGAFPWSAEFYAVSERRCFVLRRVHAPPTVIRRRASEVVRAS